MATSLPHIKDLKALAPGTVFNTVVLMVGRTVKTARNGNSYQAIELKDRTGAFTATIWSDSKNYGVVEKMQDGAILSVGGQVDFWEQKFSPKIESLTLVDPARQDEYYERLVAVSLEDPRAMNYEFGAFVVSIRDPKLKSLVSAIFTEVGRDFFFSSPAARTMHHAWRHGLVEHTLGMLRLGDCVIKLYPRITINRDLVVAGIAMHDLCKVTEYTQDLSTQITVRGRLLGHVSMIYGLIVKHAAVLNLDQATTDALAHIVLSHHGKLEFGAPVLPATPEAIVVSQIDLLDSRMGALQAAMRADENLAATPYNKFFETSLVFGAGSTKEAGSQI